MDAPRYRSYAPLAAILLAATLLQAALWVRLPTISADGIIFIRLARELAAEPLDTMRTEDQHPGFPALLLAATRAVQASGYRVEPEAWMLGGTIVSFVCGVLSVAVVWLLARDLFDAKIASIATIVFTVLPVPRTLAVDAQSDAPHALFYLLAAWLATTGLTTGNAWRLAAAGLAGGAAFWIRPEGLEPVVVAVPVLLWHGIRTGWPWRRLALAGAALAGVAFVVAMPYMLLAGKITSKQLQFFKQHPGLTYIELLAEAEPPVEPESPLETAAAALQKPSVPEPTAPEPVDSEPRLTAALFLSVLGRALSAFINSICQGFKFIFIPFYLLGNVALLWRSPPRVQVAYLALLGAAHIAILLAVFVSSGYIAHRHVIPLVGLAMPFVALGIVAFGSWISRVSRVRPAHATLATLAASCVVVMPYTLRNLNHEFVPVIAATRWVETVAEPGSGILSNSPYVDFYSGLPVAELSDLRPTLDVALSQAPAARYEHVVLHVNAYGYNPEWLDQLAPGYRPIREFVDPHEYQRPKKVLVLQSIDATVHSAAQTPRL